MKVFQPAPGDENIRLNVGCLVVFLLVVLAVLVGIVVGHQTCLRQFFPLPKG